MKIWPGVAAVLLATLSTFSHAGDAAAGKVKSATCAGCHGVEGKAQLPENPNLAGQGEKYLLKQLKEFSSGARENAVMAGMVSTLSEEDMEDIAAYYASLPAVQGIAKEENLELGQNIFRGGITSAGIAACAGCHGPNGGGNSAAGWPSLAGQNASYLYTTLQHFRAGTRANDPNEMMRSLANRLTNDEIAAVSNYIQGLR